MAKKNKTAIPAEKAAVLPEVVVPAIREGLRYIVAMKPGSAAEGALRYDVPAEFLQGSLDEIIQYGLGPATKARKAEQIAATIKGEMKRGYGLTVNGEARLGKDKSLLYFTEKTMKGNTYMGLDLIVASKQTGGAEYYFK